MKRIALIASIGLVLALCLTVTMAGVEARTVPPRGSWPQQRQQIQDQRSKLVMERIDTIIARFNNNKDRHVAAYNAVKDKVQEVVTAMSAKGYDVSKLTSDLQAWDQMIIKFAQDYASFIDLLAVTEQHDPYTSQGAFLAALDQARAELRIARQDSLDLRNYYQTTIRPDVKALESQSPKSSAPASSTP